MGEMYTILESLLTHYKWGNEDHITFSTCYMPRRTDRMYYSNNNTVMKKGFYSSEYHFGDFLFGMERVYI